MGEIIHIHKAAGILVRDRRLLVERSYGKRFFIAPGGSIETGETPQQALVRELKEEFRITVHEDDLSVFGTFKALAAGQEDKLVKMHAYMVNAWVGEPLPDNEVEELRWITSRPEPGIEIGSIFMQQVIPRLRSADIID